MVNGTLKLGTENKRQEEIEIGRLLFYIFLVLLDINFDLIIVDSFPTALLPLTRLFSDTRIAPLFGNDIL